MKEYIYLILYNKLPKTRWIRTNISVLQERTYDKAGASASRLCSRVVSAAVTSPAGWTEAFTPTPCLLTVPLEPLVRGSVPCQVGFPIGPLTTWQLAPVRERASTSGTEPQHGRRTPSLSHALFVRNGAPGSVHPNNKGMTTRRQDHGGLPRRLPSTMRV